MGLRDVLLPSGATLRIQPATFGEARALLSVFTQEFRRFGLKPGTDYVEVIKELACITFGVPSVEQALWSCMRGCLYVPAGSDVPLKLAMDIFEVAERRVDYIQVAMEVAKENVGPFMKHLFALFSEVQGPDSSKSPASGSTTTSSSSTSGSAGTAMPPG